MIVRQAQLSPIEFRGLRIFDYTADADLGVSVAVVEVPGGARHAEAYNRRSDKYYLVLAGAVSFELNGNETVLRAGDFCRIERGSRFAYRNAAGEPAKLLLVHQPRFDLSAEVFANS